MKKSIIYSAIVLLLASVACNKTDHVVSGDGNIRFAPATAATRALIEDVTGLQAETFQVYDFMGETKYIDETISYADGAWNYASGSSYAWKDGSHKMFGYTSGAGEFANSALSVSKTLTAAEANQVDILYSNVVSTTAEAWKATEGNTVSTPVALHMKHLFAAVSIMVKNATTNDVTLNKADVKIPNKGSATVTFGDETSVSYGDVTTDGAFITATQFTGAIAAVTETADGGLVDVLTQQTVATDTLYQVVWPQTFAEGSELEVTVNYTMNGVDYNKDVKLPATTWAAGKKYTYILNIYPTETKLDFVVEDWTPGTAGNIDTEDGSINMSNVTWMNTKVKLTQNGEEVNTVVNGSYRVDMYYNAYAQNVNTGAWELHEGYFPAQGYFTVNYPINGLFKIELIPAYGETEVDSDMYEIWIYDSTLANPNDPQHPGGFVEIDPDGEPISNDTVYFQVRAASGQDGAQHKAQINIWFKPDGSSEWISAYSEIRANYALTIPAV